MPKFSPASRVVFYARVSTEEQASDNHYSIQAQINEMHEFAQRHGWEEAGVFIDEGISGTRRDRPQLLALLELARSRSFDILLVHELSRLSRSVYHTLDIFDFLGKQGVGFASVKDPDFDFADPSKRLFLTILAAINEYYINLLRLHTSKSKRERARQGLYNASITPYGYRNQGTPKDPPVIDEEEAKVIRLAYEQYASGHYSHLEIAELLNDQGYRTRPSSRQPKGRRFSKDTVAEILRNPFYMGKVVYHKHNMAESELFDGQHEPLIAPELWDRCQSIRTERRSSSRAVQKPYRVYLLSNLATCDVCGRKLRSQAAMSGTYYRETSYERGYLDCPHGKVGTRTEPVDNYIHAIIKSIHLPESWLEDVAARLEDDDEIEGMHHRRESLEAERRRLKEMKIAGEFDEDADLYYAEMNRIRRELDNMPGYDELESLRGAVAAVKDLHETWEQADSVDQRDLLRLMLRQVEVDVPNGRVVSITPQAVFIPILRDVPLLAERDFGVFTPLWPSKLDEQSGVNPLNVPVLPAVTTPAEHLAASPFLTDNLLDAEPGARISPGISRALAMVKEAGQDPEMLIQVTAPGRGLLPADLRKWPLASANSLPLVEILRRPEESADVLVSQFLIGDRVLAASDPDQATFLVQMAGLLTQGGVWYMQELLPLDMPSHWVYQFFPEAWPKMRRRAISLHTLYTSLQTAGFQPEVKRQVWQQPVSLEAALSIAREHQGLLAMLSEQEYDQGIKQLETLIRQKGADHPVGSEVAMAEIWAQKKAG